MAIDLSGTWKSRKNSILNIGADGGKYEITQTDTVIVVKGKNDQKKWENIGYAQFTAPIETGTELEFYWTDTISSTSPEKQKDHKCTVKVIDDTKTEVTAIITGGYFSFGNWERT